MGSNPVLVKKKLFIYLFFLTFFFFFFFKYIESVLGSNIAPLPPPPPHIFSSPEPKAHGELIVYQSICRLSVGLCVHIFKHEYL